MYAAVSCRYEMHLCNKKKTPHPDWECLYEDIPGIQTTPNILQKHVEVPTLKKKTETKEDEGKN